MFRVRFRVLPIRRSNGIQGRTIITVRQYGVPYTDILLHRADLHPKQWTTIETMSKQDFKNIFQMEWPLCGVKWSGRDAWKRLLTVVPLELPDNSNKVLPLPFMVDTGAPGIAFLGFKLRQLLYELHLLKEIPSSVAPYKLYGSLLWKENRINNPFVDDMPKEHEIKPDNDIRTNVIGLEGILTLEIWKDFGDIREATELLS